MDQNSRVQELLDVQRRRVTGLTGLVLASTDGRPVAASMATESASTAAAVSASSLQLARRLADLLGDGALDEIVVRSADGYVIVVSVGARWVLVALTVRSANVAMINLAFRDLVPTLLSNLEAPAPSIFAQVASGLSAATNN